MNPHDAALATAGLIGASVALIHGVLVQRLMTAPLNALPTSSATVRRLAPPLLQFSTFNWFIGGVGLMLAAFAFEPQARLVCAALVGSSYLFGALGNLWATRGRHPGWALYAVAVGLIVYGAGDLAG